VLLPMSCHCSSAAGTGQKKTTTAPDPSSVLRSRLWRGLRSRKPYRMILLYGIDLLPSTPAASTSWVAGYSRVLASWYRPNAVITDSTVDESDERPAPPPVSAPVMPDAMAALVSYASGSIPRSSSSSSKKSASAEAAWGEPARAA